MKNLAQLLTHRRVTSPEQRFGIVGTPGNFGSVYDRSARIATLLSENGVSPGARVAVIGSNSESYLVAYCALQLAGVETALMNPTYPSDLLREMLADLDPAYVVWIGPTPTPELFAGALHIDASDASSEVLTIGPERLSAIGIDARDLAGLERLPTDIAGYMHTSGTTGTPKFCAQTHEYFLRLGRFIADTMGLCETDTVLAPLPLFHVNPMGYGVIGSLVAGAGMVSAERFSASRFWTDVVAERVTALVLHAPPMEILKRSTSREDAAGHQVRIVFLADEEFLTEFQIPLGMSGYGSTEAGGLCHAWLWRRGDAVGGAAGMSRYAGRSRHDIRWRVTDDGEIEVAGNRPGVLFDGYWKAGELRRPFDDAGWFATGDLGRIDDDGNLVYVERRTEAIRVKGEFVPINFVEDHFAKLPGIRDLAIWRRPSSIFDDEVMLFVVGDDIDEDAVRSASLDLPAFMRPAAIIRIAEIPRNVGVGKILRRALNAVPAIEVVEMA